MPDLRLDGPWCFWQNKQAVPEPGRSPVAQARDTLWPTRLRHVRHVADVVLSGMIVAAGKKAKQEEGRHRARTAGQIKQWAIEVLRGSMRSDHAYLRKAECRACIPD